MPPLPQRRQRQTAAAAALRTQRQMQQRGGRRCSSRRCLSGTTRQHRRPRVSQAAAAVAGVPVDAVAAAAATVGAGVDDAAAQVAEQMVDAATQRKEVQGWIAACLSRFAAAARCPSHGGPRVSPPAIGKPNARPAGLCKIVWTCRRLLRCHFSSGGRVSWGCAPPQRARSRPPPSAHTRSCCWLPMRKHISVLGRLLATFHTVIHNRAVAGTPWPGPGRRPGKKALNGSPAPPNPLVILL